MKITLRKANAIQASIQEAIRNVKVETNVELNEFQNVESEIQNARAKLLEGDKRREALLKALYGIRGAVGTANATATISDSLAQAAYLDKRIGQIEALATASVQTAKEVLEGKLDKFRKEPGESSRRSLYGYNDTVSTGVMTQSLIDSYKDEVKALKKQKQSINDKILELNIRTEITLADETVATLQAEGLI